MSNLSSIFELIAINFKDFINSLQTCQEVRWWIGLGAIGQI